MCEDVPFIRFDSLPGTYMDIAKSIGNFVESLFPEARRHTRLPEAKIN